MIEDIAAKMFACKGGAVFVLTRGNYVLLEKCPKKATMFGGTWFIPGGKMENDESAEECCKREAFEELGISIRRLEQLPIIDGAPQGWPFFALHPFYVVEYEGEVPLISTDGVALCWTSVAEALQSPDPQVRMMIAASLPYIQDDA